MTTQEYLFYSGNNASLNTVTKQDGLVWYSEHFLESGRPLSDFLELANVGRACWLVWLEFMMGSMAQAAAALTILLNDYFKQTHHRSCEKTGFDFAKMK